MTALDAIGLAGATALAVSGLPQAVQSWRQGHSDGVSWGLLALWLGGEAAMVAYVLGTTPDPVLLINYGGNLAIVAVIAWFAWRPR